MCLPRTGSQAFLPYRILTAYSSIIGIQARSVQPKNFIEFLNLRNITQNRLDTEELPTARNWLIVAEMGGLDKTRVGTVLSGATLRCCTAGLPSTLSFTLVRGS